ncbi:hypothetical protein [Brevundimonas sp.]|uniref:hypothetical protein n=1 Tax=Brevundimonas sp. TaxID=1871086 RepID=UPI00289684E9|nr:hypothetical protein [Brevundimonas sp.]
MTRYKGASKKGNVTLQDLAEIEDCYRRVTRIITSLNMVSPAKLPLMACSATLKACWAELSGAQAATGWSFPDSCVDTPKEERPQEFRPMKRIGVASDWE